MLRPPPRSPLFPSRRSSDLAFTGMVLGLQIYYTLRKFGSEGVLGSVVALSMIRELGPVLAALMVTARAGSARSEEHTSELQSHHDLVCRLLLEKKKAPRASH